LSRLTPHLIALALAAAATGGCGPKGKGTTMVVTVLSDLVVGTEIDGVHVVIAGGELSYPFALGSGAGKSTLPIRVALVPGGNADRQFRVEAAGLLGSDTVVSQSATVSFVPGSTQELVLFLARSCVRFPQCPEGSTCEGGACVMEATAGSRGNYGKVDAGLPKPDTGGDGTNAADVSSAADGADLRDEGTGNGAGGSGGGGGGAAGSPGSGGRAGTGGNIGAGGTFGSGGTTGAGGTVGTGGRLGTGGTIGKGGSLGSGGTLGTGGVVVTVLDGGVSGGVLFSDNFETGNASQWTPSMPADWQVVADSTLVYKRSGAITSGNTATAGDPTWRDVIIDARINVVSFVGTTFSYLAGVCGRVNLTTPGNYYCLILREDGRLSIRRSINYSATFLATTNGAVISSNTWYSVRFSLIGTTLTAYLNGTQMLTTTDSTFASGSIGLTTDGANAEFDDINVTSP
jgi:hypothetical protein